MAQDKLIGLFAAVLNVPAEELNEESSPANEKRWDSLAAMQLVAAIEEQFDIELSTAEIMMMDSIGIARKVLRTKNVIFE